MHISVWIITRVEDPRELAQAFREAEQTAEIFNERNFRTSDPDNDIMPPIRYDYRRVGGRYEGDLGTPGSGNWSTGEMAAARPREVLPRAVITPQGYSVLLEDEDDEGEDLRRVLLNWPENVVILHNWHY